MSRKGREFEKLVAFLEKMLTPDNFEIKSPDFFDDKDTGQKREIDISVTGKVGATPIKIIIECRDRTDPQNVTWIEQINSKKEGVNASKAIAVSSSGFYKPALVKAKSCNIECRTYEDIDESEIASWFQLKEMTLYRNHYEVKHSDIDIIHPEEGTVDNTVLQKTFENADANSRVFFKKKDKEYCSLNEIVAGINEIKNMWDKIPIDGKKYRHNMELNYTNRNDCFQLLAGENVFVDITVLRLVVDYSVTQDLIPIDSITAYNSAEGSILQNVSFKFDDTNGKIYMIGIHRDEQGGTHVTSQIKKDKSENEYNSE